VIFLSAILLGCAPSEHKPFSTGVAWAKSYGRTNENYAHSIHQTSDGGYIAAGPFVRSEVDGKGYKGIADSADILGISPPTVWEQSAFGAIPKPIKIGPKMKRWHRQTLEKWIQEKVDFAEQERRKLAKTADI
jgi:predicted DNA-binding transcriptional regulator AlpA